MDEWDPSQSIVQLLDKTNDVPTGTTDGGLVNGDLLATNKVLRVVQERGDGKVPTCILYLDIADNSGQFVTTAPILVDKDAFDKYLVNIQMARTSGGGTVLGKLQRYNLGIPSVVEDKDLGWVLQVPCEHIYAEVANENLTSLNEELQSPHDRISHLFAEYNTGKDQPGDIIVHIDTLNVPDDDSLRRDWTPNSAETLGDAIQEVLDTLKLEGPSGGVFKNYFYWIEASATDTFVVKINFDEFGANDSGITIAADNENAAPIEKQNQTSNKKRRNKVVVRFSPRGAALRMEFTKFASTFQHAKFRNEWSSGIAYSAGSAVKYTFTSENPYIIRYFTALQDVGPSATAPDQDPTNWLEDFTIIPEWTPNALYDVGEVVSVTTPFGISPNVTFYRCTTKVAAGGSSPPNANWTTCMRSRFWSLLSYKAFYSYTPNTADLPAMKANLCGTDNPPVGYLGLMPDWNYERQINDLVDYTNRFLLVTGKSFRRVMAAPPTGKEPYTGIRILVKTGATGAFAGHDNQIAEYERDPLLFTSTWHFSNNPVDGDTVTALEQGAMLKWSTSIANWVSGTGYNAGEYVIDTFDGKVYLAKVSIAHSITAPHSDAAHWLLNPTNKFITIWGIDAAGNFINKDKPGPFHAVKDMYLVAGSTGVPAQAIRFHYDWKDGLEGGNDINKTSRGVWGAIFYPSPVVDTSSKGLGYYYGGDGTGIPNNPMVNHQNLNMSAKGNVGWNQDDSEDLGRLPNHNFKIRVGFFSNPTTDDNSKTYGKSNITMVYWRKDANGRFFFKDFIVPENFDWYPMSVQLPPFGPTNLYFNRLNELAEILGYTIPVDIFIQEKEYAGVQYEWRKNQAWGVFCKDTYLGIGMYQGCYRNILDTVGEALSQAIPVTLKGINAIATQNWSQLATLIAQDPHDHTVMDIDEEHYVKEGYAIYPNQKIADCRAEEIDLLSENDYLTAQSRAQATYIQDNFFPSERYVTVTGNMEIEYGRLVTETGIRVPGGTLTSVVANLKETFDNNGFNQELYLIRKFVIS